MRYLILTVATVFAVSLVSGQTLATAQTRAAYGQDQQAEKQQSQQTIGQNQQQGRQNGSQQLNSDQVRKLQQALKDKGYNPGQVDGIIGSQTRQALRQFQQSQGIASTGKVNPKTRAGPRYQFPGIHGSGATIRRAESTTVPATGKNAETTRVPEYLGTTAEAAGWGKQPVRPITNL